MSRIGKMPIPLPEGVTLQIKEGEIEVKGPKGSIRYHLVRGIEIKQEGKELLVVRADDSRSLRSLHGLYRSLVQNMVQGVCEEFSKTLVLNGVGYRAQKQGEKLSLQLGFSHPVEVTPPKGIHVDVQGNNKIVVHGINKEKVGQFAADIRWIRPVEPYKGKGIRYENEWVRRKAGKAGKVGAKAA